MLRLLIRISKTRQIAQLFLLAVVALLVAQIAFGQATSNPSKILQHIAVSGFSGPLIFGRMQILCLASSPLSSSPGVQPS